MLHVYVRKLDVTDSVEKNLGTKAPFTSQKISYSAHHIEFLDTCMKH